MDKIKKYWMPAIAALFVIAGLSDFSMATILLGAGMGYVWWKDLRDASSVNKKAVTFKIIRWLLAGVGCDMLIYGSVVGGLLLLGTDVLWSFGKLKSITVIFKSKGSGFSQAMSSSTFDGELVKEASMSDDERIRLICKNAIVGAWNAVAECDCAKVPSLEELKSHLKRCALNTSEIVSIETHPFYIGKITADVEKRSWERCSAAIDSGNLLYVKHQDLNVWNLPLGPIEETHEWNECTTCHNEKKVVCPECHGKKKWQCSDCHGNASWDCPDCHGEKGLEYECSDCHGKGELFCHTCEGKGIVQCDECDGDGVVICSVCRGYGKVKEHKKYEVGMEYVTCPNCHGKRTDVCTKCNGTGERRCKDCGGRGIAVCQQCKGVGETACSKCGSTGKVHCSTCSGSGEIHCNSCSATGFVKCPTCHGDGGFAHVWKVVDNQDHVILTRSWSDDVVPQDALPDECFYDKTLVGVNVVYSKRSEKNDYDIGLTEGVDKTFRCYVDELYGKLLTICNADACLRLRKQSIDIERVDGLARVEIKINDLDDHDSGNVDVQAPYVCWINLVTASVERITKGDAAISVSRALTELDSLGDVNQSHKRALVGSVARLGNSKAMLRYSQLLYKAEAASSSQESCLWREMSHWFGETGVASDDRFAWDSVGMSQVEWIVAHCPCLVRKCRVKLGDARKLMVRYPEVARYYRVDNFDDFDEEFANDQNVLRFIDYQKFFVPSEERVVVVLDSLIRNGSLREALTPDDWAGIVGRTGKEMEGRIRKLAKAADFDSFTVKQKIKVLTKRVKFSTANVFDLLRLDVKTLNIKDLAALAYTSHNGDSVEIGNCISERIAKFSVAELFEFLYEGSKIAHCLEDGEEACTQRFKMFSDEDWNEFFLLVEQHRLSFLKYDDLIDLKNVLPKLCVGRLVYLWFDTAGYANSPIDENVVWSELADLQAFDFGSLTDDARVEFALAHEDIAKLVLKCGFDPNRIRPWCIDLSYDKWPERMSTFDPERYDWSQCSPCMWAQIVYGHPEFEKYCHVGEVCWHELDEKHMKYWKWALGGFGEKVVPYFSKWSNLDDDRWNDIIKKQPKLLAYKKKYFSKA